MNSHPLDLIGVSFITKPASPVMLLKDGMCLCSNAWWEMCYYCFSKNVCCCFRGNSHTTSRRLSSLCNASATFWFWIASQLLKLMSSGIHDYSLFYLRLDNLAINTHKIWKHNWITWWWKSVKGKLHFAPLTTTHFEIWNYQQVYTLHLILQFDG